MQQGSRIARHIAPTPEAACAALADWLIPELHAAVTARGVGFIALTGGRTPRLLYTLLAAPPRCERIPWERLQVFFSDERVVPMDHPDSNFGMARAALLAHVPLSPLQVHPMVVDPADPEAAAHRYAAALDPLPRADGWPQFDVLLLGLGPDGHIASLFPGSPGLTERERTVLAHRVPSLDGAWRISLSLPVLERAREVAFLVTGADKAHAVAAAFDAGPEQRLQTELLPVQRYAPTGHVHWFLDTAAAGRLTEIET